MAISNTVAVADGKPSRPATLIIDTDGTASFLTGTVLGATIDSSLGGVAVDASTAESYTTTAAMTPDALIRAFVDDLDAKLTGVRVSFAKNKDDIYVIRFMPIARVADDVNVGTPVFTAGS